MVKDILESSMIKQSLNKFFIKRTNGRVPLKVSLGEKLINSIREEMDEVIKELKQKDNK